MMIRSIFSLLTILPLLVSHCHGSPIDLTSTPSGLERRVLSPGVKTSGPSSASSSSPYLSEDDPSKFTSQVNEFFKIPAGYAQGLRKRWMTTAPDGSRSVLIYTDGAFDQEKRKAGFGINCFPDISGHSLSLPLERVEGQQYTLERTKLRAVLAALQFRVWNWADERFKRVVVATDSRYVITGVENRGEYSRDRDLWELLWKKVDEYEKDENSPAKVQFLLLSTEKKELPGAKLATEAANKGKMSETIPTSLQAAINQPPELWAGNGFIMRVPMDKLH